MQPLNTYSKSGDLIGDVLTYRLSKLWTLCFIFLNINQQCGFQKKSVFLKKKWSLSLPIYYSAFHQFDVQDARYGIQKGKGNSLLSYRTFGLKKWKSYQNNPGFCKDISLSYTEVWRYSQEKMVSWSTRQSVKPCVTYSSIPSIYHYQNGDRRPQACPSCRQDGWSSFVCSTITQPQPKPGGKEGKFISLYL